MSRVSDLQGLVRGVARVTSASFRVGPSEASLLWDQTLVKPALQQAVTLVVEGAKSVEKVRDSRKGIPVSKMVDNIPVVLEGLQLYLTTVTGLGPLYRDQNISESEGLTSDAERYEVDRDVTAMQLLEVDLTDEVLLRRKIYKRVEQPMDEAGLEKFGLGDIEVSGGGTQLRTLRTPPKLNNKPSPVLRSHPAGSVRLKELSAKARERKVPASRLSRVASFAGLGAGLAVGTVMEASRRALGQGVSGQGRAATEGSLLLNQANASRIVSTLCRVRGAALKLGQILSIQDGAVISPELQEIFDRVREAADYMPDWQLTEVMSGELGPDWRSQFSVFSPIPFAAASIGQVHRATLPGGEEVAVKVQYPGVAKSIDSDIRNVLTLVATLGVLPKGLFVEDLTKNMKIELAEECDYRREADCGATMKEILAQYPEYYVPRVYPSHSAGQVLTTEYIQGLTIDQCVTLDQGTRDHIAEAVLKLVFRELFLHRYMQTDPNWANFLYNPNTKQLGLLDFGATRQYRPTFVNTYFKIIDGAAHGDRESVLEYSRELGFLTGSESKAMNSAHVESVMLLAKPFHKDQKFDFGKQTITSEIQELTGVMLRERLCPPPPEVYSLHRKLSGLFLLSSKLEARFNCYGIWQQIRSQFKPFPLESE